ncbi:MAG: hypothetical protein QM803_01265 [Rhodocyclaceae bacterium]
MTKPFCEIGGNSAVRISREIVSSEPILGKGCYAFGNMANTPNRMRRGGASFWICHALACGIYRHPPRSIRESGAEMSDLLRLRDGGYAPSAMRSVAFLAARTT